jgi:hypothetical protein
MSLYGLYKVASPRSLQVRVVRNLLKDISDHDASRGVLEVAAKSWLEYNFFPDLPLWVPELYTMGILWVSGIRVGKENSSGRQRVPNG